MELERRFPRGTGILIGIVISVILWYVFFSYAFAAEIIVGGEHVYAKHSPAGTWQGINGYETVYHDKDDAYRIGVSWQPREYLRTELLYHRWSFHASTLYPAGGDECNPPAEVTCRFIYPATHSATVTEKNNLIEWSAIFHTYVFRVNPGARLGIARHHSTSHVEVFNGADTHFARSFTQYDDSKHGWSTVGGVEIRYRNFSSGVTWYPQVYVGRDGAFQEKRSLWAQYNGSF